MINTSVIIPTPNVAGPLRRCLEALLPAFPPNAETIVVCDGGTVDPLPQLGDLVVPLNMRFVQVPHGGPGYARNRGLEAARGEIACFTDDDCRPHPGWVAAIAALVTASPPRATGGVTVNGKTENPYADAAQVILELVSRHEVETCGEVRFFPTNNCAFPIAPLRKLGGFDETFRTAEDRDLLRRWRTAGHGVTFAPLAVVDHEADPDLVAYVRKFYGYGRGAARFHATDGDHSYRDSASFHMRLPALVRPELKARGPRRSAALLGLLALWEAANLAGFVVESTRRLLPGAAPNGKRA